MKIISGTTDFRILQKTAVAIGKFDGIHIGHKLLLTKILEAKKEGLAATVFTFDPLPAVLFGGGEQKEITTLEEKRRLFEEIGIDYLVEYPLTYETAAIDPEQYVREFLLERMNAKRIVAGKDITFGHKGRGNSKLLQQITQNTDCTVELIDKIMYNGLEVSSSLIREKISTGEIEDVNAMLGEPFFISGEIAHGNQIGRTIGFPTINVIPGKGKVLPPNGVYFSDVYTAGGHYNGITNIGSKPTIQKENVITAETFLYHFNGNIYGKTAHISLLHFVRPEQKFTSLDELKAMIDLNVLQGQKYFENRAKTKESVK